MKKLFGVILFILVFGLASADIGRFESIHFDNGADAIWHIYGTSHAFAVKDVDKGLYRLWIRNDNGDFGIGTTTPRRDLHVFDVDQDGHATIAVETTNPSGDATYQFRRSGRRKWQWFMDASDGDKMKLYDYGLNKDVISVGENDGHSVINFDGTVRGSRTMIAEDFCTTDLKCLSMLNVNGNSNEGNSNNGNEGNSGSSNGYFGSKINIGGGSGWDVFGTESAFAVKDLDSGLYRLWIRDSDGNVGIGTSSPSAKLDVAGNIKASGTICDGFGNCLNSVSGSGSSGGSGGSEGNTGGDVQYGTWTIREAERKRCRPFLGCETFRDTYTVHGQKIETSDGYRVWGFDKNNGYVVIYKQSGANPRVALRIWNDGSIDGFRGNIMAGW